MRAPDVLPRRRSVRQPTDRARSSRACVPLDVCATNFCVFLSTPGSCTRRALSCFRLETDALFRRPVDDAEMRPGRGLATRKGTRALIALVAGTVRYLVMAKWGDAYFSSATSLWIILVLFQNVLQQVQGYFLAMITESQVHVVNEGESVAMECQFHADQYSLFDYPVLWRKVQRDEETQMNIMSNINDPFASSNRFEVSFTPLAPRYRFELSIKDVTQLDSGNYTCDVRGPYSSLLGQSTHFLFVRSNVQSVYIFDPDRTQQATVKSVRLTEGLPTRIRCVSVGGFPPPSLQLYLGEEKRDVTSEFAYHSSMTLSGRRGLRTITYRVERWSETFKVKAEDNDSTLTCVATIPGLKPVSEFAVLDVDFAPKLSCSQASAYLSDKNVHIKCEISAKPPTTSILWVIDTNGTLLAEGQVVNGYWTIIMERADGIVETQLALGQPKTDSFRQYTLIVENHIGISKADVDLIQKFRKQSLMKMGPQSDSVLAAASDTNRTESAAAATGADVQEPSLVPVGGLHHPDRINHELQMDKLHQHQNQHRPTSSSSSTSSLGLRQDFYHPRSTFVGSCPLTVPLITSLLIVKLLNSSV